MPELLFLNFSDMFGQRAARATLLPFVCRASVCNLERKVKRYFLPLCYSAYRKLKICYSCEILNYKHNYENRGE